MKSRAAALFVASSMMLSVTTLVRSAERDYPPPIGIDPAGFSSLVDQSAPVAVSGQVLDASQSAAEASVEAFAWPNLGLLAKIGPGVQFTTLPVAAAVAGADGSFELRISKETIPQDYIAKDGQVDLELVAWNTAGQAHSFVSVRADSVAGNVVWVAPTAGDSTTMSAAGRAHVSVSLALSEPLTSALAAEQPAPKPVCGWVLDSSYSVWSQIGDSFVYNSTQTSWMKDSSSHTVTVGVAVAGYQGISWSASGTASTTTGVDFEWSHVSLDRYYDVGILYGKYREMCGSQIIEWSFKPRYPTGGYRYRTTTYNPPWTYCASVSAGTWTRNTTSGNTFNLSTGVDASPIISIDLSMNTNYSSTRSLSYYQSVSRHLCGNNDYPSLAGRIEGEA